MNSLEEGYLKGKIIGLEHQIDQFKQQLAEKDKEISKLQASCQQDKTQLGIEELEKVKELLVVENKNNPIVYDINDNTVGGALDRDKTFEIINQQIKELKG